MLWPHSLFALPTTVIDHAYFLCQLHHLVSLEEAGATSFFLPAMLLCCVRPDHSGLSPVKPVKSGEPMHEPAQCPCSPTIAGALLNGVSLGLTEQVAAVTVAHT